MEDPETQDKPTSVPLNELAIQARALEKVGIPSQLAEVISRAGGTGGIQKFILSEAHNLWNDPSILGQVWHGARLWFLIKFLLFSIAVIRVLPTMLLSAFLLGVVVVVGLCIAAANRDTTTSSTPVSATTASVPYPGAIDLSAVAGVSAGTKLQYTGYSTPVMGEVTAKGIGSVFIKWQYDHEVKCYTYEQLAQDLKSGLIVIDRS